MYLVATTIGTRDLVFSQVSAQGYSCYQFGGVIILSSLVLQAATSKLAGLMAMAASMGRLTPCRASRGVFLFTVYRRRFDAPRSAAVCISSGSRPHLLPR